MSRGPNTSVIVATYNRAGSLGRLLDSLAAQTAPADSFEVVVVDDGSTDGTRVATFSRRGILPRLRYLNTGENLGQVRAADLGTASAGGEKLLYVDDDCIARPDWLEAMLRGFDCGEIVAGAVTSDRRDFLVLAHNVSAFHRFFPGRPPGPVGYLAGANFGVTREAYEKVGGFEVGHDMAFILRARTLGVGAWFQPEAVVVHAPGYVSLRSMFGYAFTHARKTIRLRQEYATTLRTPIVLKSPALLLAGSPAIAMLTTMRAYARNASLRGCLATLPLFFALKLTWCFGAAAGLRDGRRERG